MFKKSIVIVGEVYINDTEASVTVENFNSALKGNSEEAIRTAFEALEDEGIISDIYIVVNTKGGEDTSSDYSLMSAMRPDRTIYGINIYMGEENYEYGCSITGYASENIVKHKLRDDVWVLAHNANQYAKQVRASLLRRQTNDATLLANTISAINTLFTNGATKVVAFDEEYSDTPKPFTETPTVAELKANSKFFSCHSDKITDGTMTVVDVSSGTCFYDFYEHHEQSYMCIRDTSDIKCL